MARNCDDKDVQACLDLAHASWAGKPPSKADQERGWNAVKQALVADSTMAHALETASCLEKKALSCLVLKLMFERGEGVAKDETNAFAHGVLACRAGHVESCIEGARAAWKASRRGEALVLFEEACGHGSVEGCGLLATAHSARGDHETAEPAHEKACAMGFPDSCDDLGETYRGRMEGAKAEQMFLKACELGKAVSCSSAGSLYRYGTMPGDKAPVQKNTQKAREFFQRACDKGYAAACKTVTELPRS
jgi:TPR repeat protein